MVYKGLYLYTLGEVELTDTDTLGTVATRNLDEVRRAVTHEVDADRGIETLVRVLDGDGRGTHNS